MINTIISKEINNKTTILIINNNEHKQLKYRNRKKNKIGTKNKLSNKKTIG